MRGLRALAGVAVVAVLAVVAVSGGDDTDPRTPPALPGLPPPFLGTAIAGSGGLSAAIDSYGNVVDLRFPGPAGADQIDNPYKRQNAGSVPADTGIVVSAGVGGREPRPLWTAERVRQSYLSGANVVVTTAALRGGGRLQITDAVPPAGTSLVRHFNLTGPPGREVRLRVGVKLRESDDTNCFGIPADAETAGTDADGTISYRRQGRLRADVTCSFDGSPEALFTSASGLAARADRRWLARSRPLGPGAPSWARRMYDRSLLVLRALTDRKTGAVAAGARDGWAYVWPRDAATAALALRTAGYPVLARRIAEFIDRLDLGAAARFDADRNPVPGRAAQGDAAGWRRVADSATGLPTESESPGWRGLADYGERSGDDGDYLANAIAAKEPASVIRDEFGSGDKLVRVAGDPGSSIDSAVAWAVAPFPDPGLYPQVRASLAPVFASRDRYGIAPALDWPGGPEPWAAPTAWVAWSYSMLGERSKALALLGDLRRAATPGGDLPERVGARTGIPQSTTPLAWPHAFTILALRRLWPPR